MAKKRNSTSDVDSILKKKYQEELKKQYLDEESQFKPNYVPTSEKYKKQLQERIDKTPQLNQDNSTEKQKAFNKKYHDDKEWDEKKWNYYENIATTAELGNFVPHPTAQVIGKAGSAASAALAARKAKIEYDKGNYLNAGLNAGFGIFSAGLGAKAGISTVKGSKLNELEKLISPREFKSNITNGIDIGRMQYYVPEYLNTFSKNNPNVIKNRLSLGVVGADALTDFKSNDNSEYADGGQLYNKLDSKYNNYLNNDMRQYAQGGDLTRFDEGGTHEASPLGGIPQGVAPDGKQNTVEQGESKKGNFIYSNRISLDKDLVKQFNLPNYVANKSVSDASKAIDDKFKHRADKYAQETKNTLLDRLSQAQEYLKQQEQSQLEQTNQSMQANSQQIPDQMNGQIPEGMEEYAEQMPQQGQDIQNIQTSSPIAAFGGYQQHRYSGLDNPNSEINVAPPAAGATESTGPSAGAVIGAAGTAMNLGQLAFGKAAQDTSGLAASGRVGGAGMIGGSAIKGAAAGAGFGPLGAAIGGGIGLLAGVAGLGKARAAETKNTTNFALNTNSQFQDQHAFGGEIDPPVKKIKNADGSYSYIKTTTTTTPGTKGNVIPGRPGSPAVLPSAGGVNASDPGRNKAFAQARAAGLPSFNYNGKIYNTDIKLATPGKPAVAPTPDIVTPGLPPTSNTITEIAPIPNQVYNVQAQRGTAGTGVLRPGIGGGITTNNQYTANADVANRAVNAQQVYNADVNRRYAPVVDDGRSNNSAQIANRNAKAEIRRQQLQGTATATEIPTQLGLERRKVEALRSQNGFAYGGNMNQYYGGGPFNSVDPFEEYSKSLPKLNLPSVNPVSNVQFHNPGKVNENVQQIIGTTVDNDFGKNSKIALDKYRVSKGMKNIGMPLGLEDYKAMGLNASGSKINRSAFRQEIPTSLNLKKYDTDSSVINTNETGNKQSKSNIITDNIGDAMRLAPVAMNAYQLSKLQKPTGFQYQTLNNRYKPQYVDEAQMQRIVDQEGNNTMAAIGQMGGSEGGTRNAILAMGLNKTKGLSDAYANAAAQNRAQDSAAQQFNLGVDSQNISIRNKAIDEMRADKGAYDSAKSKFLSSIGTDIGDIGKEKNASDAAIAMFGYTRKGKYVVDKQGNKVSPETLAKRQADFATYISEQNKKDNK